MPNASTTQKTDPHAHSNMNLPTGIPLHCKLCPKKPDFSDISHLLTHIASKAHLSNEYKTKVRAAADSSAKHLLDEHESWYKKYNLGNLMAERLHQKDKRSRAPLRQTPSASSTTSRSGLPASSAPRRGSTLQESVLDPQQRRAGAVDIEATSPVLIKQEPISRPGTPFGELQGHYPLGPSYVPRMHPFSLPASPFTQTASTLTDYQTATPSDEFLEFEPTTHAVQTKGNLRRKRVDSFNSAPEAEDEDLIAGEKEAKLKGVRYDGMALFDSATPDMRRKRNQKKATSVVDHLRATSESIEAEEQVHDQCFVHQITRPITGDPAIPGSPLVGEESPEPEELPAKKRVARGTRKTRQPMLDRNVNNGRTSRPRPGTAVSSSRAPYFKVEDDDDDFMYGLQQPRPRQAFNIYKDSFDPDIQLASGDGQDQDVKAPNEPTVFHGRSGLYSTSERYHQTSDRPKLALHSRSSPLEMKPSVSPFGNAFGFQPPAVFNSGNESTPTGGFASFGSLNHNLLNANSFFNQNYLRSGHSSTQPGFDDIYRSMLNNNLAQTLPETCATQQGRHNHHHHHHQAGSPSHLYGFNADINSAVGDDSNSVAHPIGGHPFDHFDIFDGGFGSFNTDLGGDLDVQDSTGDHQSQSFNTMFTNSTQPFIEDDQTTLSPPPESDPQKA